jgi:MFS family permease
LFLYAAIGIFFFLLPMNLIQVQGYSALAAGAATLPLILLLFFLSRWSGGLVAHYGPKIPLVVGPFIATLGFVLFAVPSIGGNYWRVFFPAVMILGFGMALTVAPLTTVVMSSVHQERAGTASGINNAVARVAGVLAVAVLGIVLVKAFDFRLTHVLAGSVPAGVLQQLQKDEIKLAAIEVPVNLDAKTQAAVKNGIDKSFIFGFRIVMLICAGLSLASATMAWLMISEDGVRSVAA